MKKIVALCIVSIISIIASDQESTPSSPTEILTNLNTKSNEMLKTAQANRQQVEKINQELKDFSATMSTIEQKIVAMSHNFTQFIEQNRCKCNDAPREKKDQ